jgi:hypothetical protein
MEVITEHSDYTKRLLLHTRVPISPDVAFKAEDVPELPDPLKQKHYRSFVEKLQFAATWIWYEISFAVS